MKLLSVGNPKTLKGMKQGYNTFILHLAPGSLSGHNTCPKATAGCLSACLNTAGRGGMFKRGENTNTIDAVVKGDDITVSFNYKYINDCFQSIESDSLTFSFVDQSRPLVIKGSSDSSYLYLVMPMNK